MYTYTYKGFFFYVRVCIRSAALHRGGLSITYIIFYLFSPFGINLIDVCVDAAAGPAATRRRYI